MNEDEPSGALEELRRRIQAQPPQIQHPYHPPRPNADVPLYDGSMKLRRKEDEYPVEGTLVFQWLPSPHVRLDGWLTAAIPPGLTGGEPKLVVPEIELAAPCHLTAASHDLQSGTHRISGSLAGAPWVGCTGAVDEVVFLLPNFADYLGTGYRTTDNAVVNGRLRLTADPWFVEVDQLPEAGDIRKNIHAHGGYGIAHLGRFQKLDGSEFSREEAGEFLELLHFLFSFTRGLRSGPVVPIGLRGGKRVWERWVRANVSPHSGVRYWFPSVRLEDLDALVTGFLDRWESPAWKETLRIAIHTYTASNENEGALEGSLVLAQTALELLTWAYFEEEGGKSLRTAEDLKWTDERIGFLLDELGIPRDLPEWPHELRQTGNRVTGRVGPITDGPELVTWLRNRIVHPQQKRRDQIRPISARARFHVRQLALWYVELILLRVCAYSGAYTNRLGRSTSRRNLEEETPWSLGEG